MPCKEEEDKVNVSNLDEVKDANRQLSPHVRVFQTPFLYLVNYSTGSRTRGYLYSRLPDAFLLSTFIIMSC